MFKHLIGVKERSFNIVYKIISTIYHKFCSCLTSVSFKLIPVLESAETLENL